MLSKGTNGSEIHRLKEFDHYDKERFDKMYKICKPLIRKLASNIDPRRYNVSKDILQSYFWDKFLYVFRKYQDIYDDERLKATLLSSLGSFRNKLLRAAYTQQAEFNQELTSLDILFDNNKEFLDDSDETLYKEDLSIRFHRFLQERLTPDEYLLFKTMLDPPPFFKERLLISHGKMSALHLIDFFELPRNKKASTIITEMRRHIKQVLKSAKTEFKR